MTARDAILAMPDEALVPVGYVRKALADTVEPEPMRIYSTDEAAADFGHSPDWWQDAARTGKVDGAFQIGPRAPWSLPRAGIIAHLGRLQAKSRNRSGRRGPYLKKDQAA